MTQARSSTSRGETDEDIPPVPKPQTPQVPDSEVPEVPDEELPALREDDVVTTPPEPVVPPAEARQEDDTELG